MISISSEAGLLRQQKGVHRLAALCELDRPAAHIWREKSNFLAFIYAWAEILLFLIKPNIFVTLKFLKLKNIFNSKSFKKV